MAEADVGLDDLLLMNGQVFVIDPKGGHWVKFVVHRVPPSPERPHGIGYSLTLHSANGERLVGFDNAHPVRSSRGPGKGPKSAHDHRHRHDTVRPYAYTSAVELLTDFWTEVDTVLKERGVQ
ncbi:DUF6516 family protein [Azospirillum doebereinerae]|uniref:toxin-antitoxin system TumE family protein n=1 Tax=Azospirillum doebereinerae TaxID=92933 RepID=UPI001EE54CC6|nr:DUF6516 family protein [Azospirillum doebereinerae]MCG5244148.1 DUF6516 family protein [Azospirillum doebereinerae]